MTPARQPNKVFNRTSFITLNGSRLFTAKDVCNIIREYCPDCEQTHTSAPAPEPDEKCYIITEEQVEYIEPEFPITAMRIRSRPHTPAPSGTLPCPELIEVETEPGLKEWVCRATTTKAPSPFEKPCFGNIAICPCDDECYTVKDCQTFFDAIVANRKDAAKSAREQVLKEKQTLVALFFEKIQSRAYSNDKLPIVYLCDIESELEFIMESLRPQPEPQQEGRR